MSDSGTKAYDSSARVTDEAEGIVEFVASVPDVVDHDGDLVARGALAKQLAGEYGNIRPKLLLDHRRSMESTVGKTLRVWEEADGLHVLAQLNLAKQAGRDAFADLKFHGEASEFSVGYAIKGRRSPTASEKAMGARQVITSWTIDEFSLVTRGANPATRLVSAKSAPDEAQHEPIPAAAVETFARLLAS